MGKNNFYQLENQFLKVEIATSEFQKLQQSSEKKLFFCYTENWCPLAGMKKKFVKKIRIQLTEKLFFTSQKSSFYQEQ